VTIVSALAMSPTLLVLAAGLGSRYGGLKQIDPVGPGGETVLDYAVFDAVRAGFGRVVFVIRREFEEIFRAQIGKKYAGRIAVDYVFQSLDALPAGVTPPADREKPWGTGHAVWCARGVVRENFAVINADDFYGADSFVQLADFLRGAVGMPVRGAPEPVEFAMIGFRLDRTLSEHGAVSRGVCSVASGRLRGIVEQTGILPVEVGAGKKFSGEETVSMNCWGFTPALFAELDGQFGAFLASRGSDPKAEFYLPAAVAALIGPGKATVRVLPTAGTWFGVTYREDKPRVQAAIAELIGGSVYPVKLFAK
jgi:MobA-like NTP transferase domain